MNNFTYLFRKLVDFFLMRRSVALILFKASAALLIASLLGWSFGLELPTKHGPLSFDFDSDASSLSWLAYLSSIAGAAGILASLVMLFFDFKRLSKKVVGILELRGLRGVAGQSIEDFWQAEIFENKNSILIDIRENIVDGQLTSPQTALEEINRIPAYIRNFENGKDRNDVRYVAGGLAAVPFTFLAGVMLDDEQAITLVDWDRQSKSWRLLDSDDDKDKIVVDGLHVLDQNSEEIGLLISLSYMADQQAIEKVFPRLPLIEFSLSEVSVNNHWSEEKQQRIGFAFFNLVQQIDFKGVKRIHLFLAAQSSAVMRLGGLYDKRNLPELIVYQYEKGADNPYPWGVKMPVADCKNGEIVST